MPEARSLAGTRRRAVAAVLGALLVAACAAPPAPAPAPPWFRGPGWNQGSERYSAWFGDSDGRILYFGLSPFWSLWWQSGGDSAADLRAPGDHLIGRFDLRERRFLAPLRVASAASGARSSVWDVLAHSNGRVYYTTYFEEIGSVAADGSDVRHFEALGSGWNELVEGPGGLVYATRYSDRPRDPARQTHSSVGVLDPEGRLLREIRIDPGPLGFRAAKSLAVDPTSGDVWVNTDSFGPDGRVSYERFRLTPDGHVALHQVAPPELHFVAFDARGRGWFAESAGGALTLRVRSAEGELAAASLGPRRPGDFVQDIKFAEDGRALLALWSREVVVARLDGAALSLRRVPMQAPAECEPPQGRSLLYTAVAFRDRLFATLFCGATVLEAPLPGP
jgi:hypothetical protein